MTVVFLSSSFYPAIGGVEKHAIEVAKRLSKKGYKIVVIAEGNTNEKFKIDNIDVHKFYFGEKGWLKKFRIWLKLWKKRNLLRNADIVHCHDVFLWYFPFRFLYLQKKVYTTFHGYETKFPISAKAVFIRKLSEKLSFGNICVGEFIKKWYGTKPNYVTYGAADKVQAKESRNKKSITRILFIGRIEKDTGVEIYLKALSILGEKIKFEVCGDGFERAEFEALGKVHGFVKNVTPYILKSDIVFASSYLSIITALSFKKPVFAVYDNPLKKDYLTMTPFSKFITITGSPKTLADKVKSVDRNKSVKKKTNLGYEWTKEQTWNKLTKLYLNLFES